MINWRAEDGPRNATLEEWLDSFHNEPRMRVELRIVRLSKHRPMDIDECVPCEWSAIAADKFRVDVKNSIL